MGELNESQGVVIRTDRGLSIVGTRITLYDVMDYVSAGLAWEQVRDRLGLTADQVTAAAEYFDVNREIIEREYREVLAQAEASRQYWQDRNCERFERAAASQQRSDHPALRASLRARRAAINLR